MHTQTLTEQAQALAAGTVSSEELTRHYLDRIQTLDTDLHSFITVTEEQALTQAKAADQRRAAREAGPLTGVPLAHKDIFCTQGVRTSCGSKMLDNFTAPYNAAVVEQLEQAGMVMLGKTNMDEFAMGSSNETSYYGAVCNPWDLDCVPGGSSGGSAAAVAARLTPAATATDTGGSIRQPAAFCGVTGLKPSYGRVSRYGMVAFASSLDQGGMVASSAEDCAWLLQAMAGFDRRDSTSVDRPVPDYAASLDLSVKGLRLGVPKEFFDTQLDAGVAAAVEEAIRTWQQLGAELVEISLPNLQLSTAAYYVIASAECSSNLARFDGVRYGYRCEQPRDLEDLYCRSRGEGFGVEVRRRILVGTYALSAGYYKAYYDKAQRVRRLISQDFSQVLKKVDAIAAPVSPGLPFARGEKLDDPLAMYLADRYTIPVNLVGLPGLSLPVRPVNGLPVGMQLIGNHFDEGRLLGWGAALQQETDWHRQIPEKFA